MSHFVRLVYNDIVDFFVHEAEGIRNGIYEFLQYTPYLLGHGELQGLSAHVPEKLAYGFVIGETSCSGKKVILDGAYRRCCNLSCESVALTLTEPKIARAVFEDDFQSPTSGVNLPCFEKVKGGIGGEYSVPTAVIGAPGEKNPDFYPAKLGIVLDIMAPQFATVFLQFIALAFFDKLRSGKFLAPDLVFRAAVLSHLYHAEPMAGDVESMNESNYLLVGEPTVSQYITKFKLMADCPTDHLFGQFNFGSIVGSLALIKQLAGLLACLASFELLSTHAVVTLLAFLPDKLNVKEQLGDTIGDSHGKTFKSEHRLMAQVRVNPPNLLHHPAGLLMVGVIKNKTYVFSLVVGAQSYHFPELERYAPYGLAPVNIRIVKETVKRILVCGHHRSQWVLFVHSGDFPQSEKREHQQTLEYAQQPIDLVVFAEHAYGVSFSHLDRTEDVPYVPYVLHCSCHIRIIEKCFDIREKRCNFVYRHGYEPNFCVVTKITHFLRHTQEPMSFFYAFISILAYLRNLNYLLLSVLTTRNPTLL